MSSLGEGCGTLRVTLRVKVFWSAVLVKVMVPRVLPGWRFVGSRVAVTVAGVVPEDGDSVMKALFVVAVKATGVWFDEASENAYVIALPDADALNGGGSVDGVTWS